MSSSASGKRSLRPLLPARPSSLPEQGTESPAVAVAPKRVLVTSACEACRTRKSKCSGSRPKCRLCVKRSTECHYVTSSTESRAQAFRRNYQELRCEASETSRYKELFLLIRHMSTEEAMQVFRGIQEDDSIETLLHQAGSGRLSSRHSIAAESVYEEFYHLLQSRPPEDLQPILDRVRSGCNVNSLLRYVRDADLLQQLSLKPECRRRYEFPYSSSWPEFLRHMDNPYLRTRIYEPGQLPVATRVDTESNYVFDMPYHGARLIEPRLTDTRISQWTSVTSDEALLRELIELYLLHSHPFLTFFHKDLFLADLKSGRRQFCSSLLVNAILASATHYHPSIRGRDEPSNTNSLCYKFFAETKRLWELEMGESRLTTLQAALIMNSIYNMDGLDQIGNVYMGEAAKIAKHLDLFKGNANNERSEMDTARHFTAWCLFSWQATVCCHYYTPTLFRQPPDIDLPDPEEDPSFYGEIYVRYPTSTTPCPLSLPSTFFETVKFRCILNDLANDLFQGPKKPCLDETVGYYRRIWRWFQSLPKCLTPGNVVFPIHLQLHLHVQYILILLFKPYLRNGSHDTTFSTPFTKCTRILDFVHETRAKFETVMRLYYLRHSFATYSPVMAQFLSGLGSMSISKADEDYISVGNEHDTRSSLILATQGLEYQGRGAHLSYIALHLLYKNLPSDLAKIVDGYVSFKQPNAQCLTPDYIRSVWPVHIPSIDTDAEEFRINVILERLRTAGSRQGGE